MVYLANGEDSNTVIIKVTKRYIFPTLGKLMAHRSNYVKPVVTHLPNEFLAWVSLTTRPKTNAG